MWAYLKKNWSKRLAAIGVNATADLIDEEVEKACQVTESNLGPNILNAADNYTSLALKGLLVWALVVQWKSFSQKTSSLPIISRLKISTPNH